MIADGVAAVEFSPEEIAHLLAALPTLPRAEQEQLENQFKANTVSL